ncbi:MAG: aminopeptidase P family N-terminal domain-containing protein, partial [Planctomycetia bacterium]
MNGIPLLDLDTCRSRRRRLFDRLAAERLDGLVVVMPEHVQYLTGHRWDFRFAPLAAFTTAGPALLVCPDKPVEQAAVDDVRPYEAKWRSTLRNDQREAAARVLGDWLAARPTWRRVGVEFSACPPHVTRLFAGAEFVDIEPAILRQRRRKDPDELALLRRAIAAAGAMYETARGMIAPGVNELDVFSALQAAAVSSCG